MNDNNLELSIAPKILDASRNNCFTSKYINYNNLEHTCKNHNFSTIIWNDGIRKEKNFYRATGIVIDIDNGLTIETAIKKLKEKNITYFLITSKSHTPELHKFHIILPFNFPVYDITMYKHIVSELSSKLFPECDTAVFDGARFIFGSPKDARFDKNISSQKINVLEKGISGQWNESLQFIDANQNTLQVADIKIKTPIICPFHEDTTPSAFIDYSKNNDNHYIHCSSCDNTFWMVKEKPSLDTVCEGFWSHGKDIFEMGLLQDEFYMQKITEKKFFILTGSNNEKGSGEKLFSYLIRNKHISHLSRIDYTGDVYSDEHSYTVNVNSGIIYVDYSPIPVKIEDNEYIESYLKDRFGQHTSFIKQWLAVYCYDNYKKLPTLIFKGGRGTGKTTFAEIVGEIYSPLSMHWHGHENNFTYESEKKLLIVEENEQSALHQYKTLKKYSGQKYAQVHKKFKDPYMVRNNMNIIILSNENIPMYVSREEMPVDESNNQFFVYNFPEINGKITANIQESILDRLGHYIKTELKSVRDSLDINNFRYSISVPITDEEIALFEDSVTDIESEADEYIQKLVLNYKDDPTANYYDFVNNKWIPTKYFKDYNIASTHFNRIIKNLKKRGYITGKSIKKQVGNEREYCYKITDKLYDEIFNN